MKQLEKNGLSSSLLGLCQTLSQQEGDMFQDMRESVQGNTALQLMLSVVLPLWNTLSLADVE